MFDYADLRGARLDSVDFSWAGLNSADLRGADLSGSNLLNAGLFYTTFDEFTTLPDGKAWTPTTDMIAYTKFHGVWGQRAPSEEICPDR